MYEEDTHDQSELTSVQDAYPFIEIRRENPRLQSWEDVT
jgi:hypothetical protein